MIRQKRNVQDLCQRSGGSILIYIALCSVAVATAAHDYLPANSLRHAAKHTSKTIQSSDGDIIDCVPFKNQPAFFNPLLKPEDLHATTQTLSNERIYQIWHQNGTCPIGTVPIRREEDIFSQMYKHNYNIPSGASTHEYVAAKLENNGTYYYGIQGTVSVWDPKVQYSSEFSLSQVWLVAGSYKNKDLNTLEAGWQVYQEIYNDNRPRFFIFWTGDSYRKTGCYNLRCPGFIQTSNRILLGGSISPTSTPGGKQIDIQISINKEHSSGNWWLKYDEETVGYWPAALLSTLKDHASRVQWGAEILNEKRNGIHSSTEMGSGQFAESGSGKASYFRHLYYVDVSGKLAAAAQNHLLLNVTNPNCYDLMFHPQDGIAPSFYYGGPGLNSKCP